MFERFTSAARDAIAAARVLAEKRARRNVEPPDLLRALLEQPAGGVARILQALRVTRESIERDLEPHEVEPRLDDAPSTALSIEVVRVLELAEAEARASGRELADTEHLLFALVRLASPPLSDVLIRAGLTIDAIRPLVAGTGEAAKDILDARGAVERSTSNVSLRDLEKKGFRKVKVLRAGDVNQLIFKAVQSSLARMPALMSLEEKDRIAADARAEYERQQAQIQEIQKREEKLAEREKRAPAEGLACPFGHGAMDRVVREGVRLAVCGECLSTLFEPGQLDALVRRLSVLTVEELHRFLEPDQAG